MYSRISSARWGLCAIVALSALLSGCASAPEPFVVALPNGYYLQRDRNEDIGLFKRGGDLIMRGPIAAYAVSRTTVAGCIGEWPRRSFGYPNESPFPDSEDCRYFILDTTSSQLERDLKPGEWRSKLKEHGAPEELRITAPILPV